MPEQSAKFHYLPTTDTDREEMLGTLGLTAVEDLFADIPETHRNPSWNLPSPLSEMELRRDVGALASLNQDTARNACFLGAGAYNHFSPSIIRQIISRGEFLTSYTPYQPEVSQGTLQVTYEFQTMICNLMDMEVANAGLYDGASSLAEAALMACRVTGRGKILVSSTASPAYQDVLRTYTEPQGLEVLVANEARQELDGDTACLVVQYPNFYGYIEDIAGLTEAAHAVGALMVVSTDPIAMGMFKPPGAYGADIVTSEGQALGLPLSFGGPYVGLLATRQQFIRQMPGRLAGRTVDQQGRTGYVLTLSTREQHIRRERATSNICTNQALMALAVTVYMSALGKSGLREVARQAYHKAHYAASRISSLTGYSIPLEGTFFQEFVVSCPATPGTISDRLLERGIIGGQDVSDKFENGILFCVTEMNTRQEIDALVDALGDYQE